jgi:hypothetical protein
MEGLEKASVGEDMVPFGDFLSGLVKQGLAGAPLPVVPKTRIMKVCGEKEDVAGWLSFQN